MEMGRGSGVAMASVRSSIGDVETELEVDRLEVDKVGKQDFSGCVSFATLSSAETHGHCYCSFYSPVIYRTG